jgi:hypothetical protein
MEPALVLGSVCVANLAVILNREKFIFSLTSPRLIVQIERVAEILKDRLGNKIGEIKTESGGKQVIYDRLGNRLGYYDPKANITYDRLGNKIGSGNLLTRLLH